MLWTTIFLVSSISCAKARSSTLVQKVNVVQQPAILSNAQLSSILQSAVAAGAPSDATLMSIQTSNGMRFSILTNGQGLRTWTAPSNDVGDRIVQLLNVNGVNLQAIAEANRQNEQNAAQLRVVSNAQVINAQQAANGILLVPLNTQQVKSGVVPLPADSRLLGVARFNDLQAQNIVRTAQGDIVVDTQALAQGVQNTNRNFVNIVQNAAVQTIVAVAAESTLVVRSNNQLQNPNNARRGQTLRFRNNKREAQGGSPKGIQQPAELSNVNVASDNNAARGNTANARNSKVGRQAGAPADSTRPTVPNDTIPANNVNQVVAAKLNTVKSVDAQVQAATPRTAAGVDERAGAGTAGDQGPRQPGAGGRGQGRIDVAQAQQLAAINQDRPGKQDRNNVQNGAENVNQQANQVRVQQLAVASQAAAVRSQEAALASQAAAVQAQQLAVQSQEADIRAKNDRARINTVENGKSSAASRDGNTAVDGENAFAQSRGAGAAVSNAAGSAFIAGQGTVAATGTTDGGLVVAIVCQNGPQSTSTSRNFNVLVGGRNGQVFSPSQLSANPGDTVNFIFGSSNHTVTQSSFDNPCQALPNGANTGFIPSQNELQSADTSDAPIMQYTVTSTQPEFFFCDQGRHCEAGMVFAINASPQTPFQSFVNAAASADATAVQNLVVATTTDAVDLSAATQVFLDVTNSTSSAASSTASSNAAVDLLGNALSPALTSTESTTSGLNVNSNAFNISSPVLVAESSSPTTTQSCLAPQNGQAIGNIGGCFNMIDATEAARLLALASISTTSTLSQTATQNVALNIAIQTPVSGALLQPLVLT